MIQAKPISWNVQKGIVAPKWRWFSDHLEMLVPIWKPGAVLIDVIRNREPIIEGSPGGGWNRFGAVVTANTGERLRYLDPGASVPFSKAQRWSAGIILSFNDVTTDQQTIFGKSSNSGGGGIRQFFIRGETDGSVAIRTDDGIVAATLILQTATGIISTDVNYHFIVTCDGNAGITLWILDLDAQDIVAEDTGTFTPDDVDLTHEVQLLAHFTSSNDDIDGAMSIFWYLDGYTAIRENVYQLLRDPFGGIRPVKDVVGFVAAAPGARPQGPLGHPLYGPLSGPIAA